jgi:anion-transporting  ArsA/GET3 family ATPase
VSVLDRQLHYVCGKGGTGRSVVACALARAFARQGHRTLLAQANAPDSHGPLLELKEPVGSEVREVERNFAVVDIEPAAAMKEYALMTLKFEAVYRTVFENRLTRAFLRFVPSLSELTIQGKIWFHCEDATGNDRFDRVVVDCPATGHGIKLLRTAQVIRDASRVGPMAEKTEKMAALVADPARTAVHVVTLPEELPVNESFDLVAEVRRSAVAPLGMAVVNQLLPRLFDERCTAALGYLQQRPADDVALAHLFEVAGRRRQREAIEREQRARVDALGLPVLELPHLFSGPLRREHIELFAARILDQVGA